MSDLDICHGCGETYRDCICEELDAERDEGKYPDDDPNDGDYPILSQPEKNKK